MDPTQNNIFREQVVNQNATAQRRELGLQLTDQYVTHHDDVGYLCTGRTAQPRQTHPTLMSH